MNVSLVMGTLPSLHDMESVWNTATNPQLYSLVTRPLIKTHCLICVKWRLSTKQECILTHIFCQVLKRELVLKNRLNCNQISDQK